MRIFAQVLVAIMGLLVGFMAGSYAWRAFFSGDGWFAASFGALALAGFVLVMWAVLPEEES